MTRRFHPRDETPARGSRRNSRAVRAKISPGEERERNLFGILMSGEGRETPGTGREKNSRTRGGRARTREREREREREEERRTREGEEKKADDGCTYASHVVRNPRSSLTLAATAGTTHIRNSPVRPWPKTHGGSSRDATRARRRFEVIYRRGCECRSTCE